jgi:hypothetical protein
MIGQQQTSFNCRARKSGLVDVVATSILFQAYWAIEMLRSQSSCRYGVCIIVGGRAWSRVLGITGREIAVVEFWPRGCEGSEILSSLMQGCSQTICRFR